MQMADLEKITSRDNGRLVAARRVRDGRENDLIFIEGKRLVAEALAAGLTIEQLFVSDRFEGADLILSAAAGSRHAALLSGTLFRTICDTKNPQGVAVIARRPVTGPAEIRVDVAALPLAVCLVEVNNPVNLGAVIRTAEAAGAAGTITSEDSTDPFSPKALRAAMGGTFRLPIWDNASMRDVITWAREQGLKISAAALEAEMSYLDVDWRQRRMLVLGSEAHGVDLSEIGQADERIRIPMQAEVESLNLAVAAGVLLFEARRRIMSAG